MPTTRVSHCCRLLSSVSCLGESCPAQGTGVGRALMEFAELMARRLKLTRLTLYTHVVMTENQAIYAHLGYREVERRTADGYHRVYMEKPLQPGGSGRRAE